jgi:hypothetical protein
MLPWLRDVMQTIQPALVPVCLALAWSLVLMVAWNLWSAMRDSVARAKTMHQIPCATCRFYSGDYRLKCPVHPTLAMTESAINCPDYEDGDPARRFLQRDAIHRGS